jgi:15-cis-phytoene synthase
MSPHAHPTRAIGADTTHPSADAVRLLAKHGKTFRWAGALLPHQTLADAATLYAFCRRADDMADCAPSAEIAAQHIAVLRAALAARDTTHAVVGPLVLLAQHKAVDLNAAQVLLATLGQDVGARHLETERDLLDYAYGVAGTVGVMMCPLLGIAPSQPLSPLNHAALAVLPASRLGMAMQLTNIARDVLEDAERGRVYLPRAWAPQVTAQGVLAGEAQARAAAWQGVLQLLRRADALYREADTGMHYLPARARLSIYTASRVYEAIGHEIVRNGEQQYWRGRTVVSRSRKAWHTLRAAGAFLRASPAAAPAVPAGSDGYAAPFISHEVRG